MQILIVDDSPVALALLRGTLRQAGYDVWEARDGREALEALRRGGCRLVICDWEMPVMDGLALCRAVRAADLPGYTYVIMLTCHDTQQEKVRGLQAGADDFIAKPFDREELLARVRGAERVLSLETRDVAIFALARLAESRDPETGAHLERVRGYCRVIAQHLAGSEKFRDRLTGEYIRLLHQTSPLHDIGKVGIPDAVLLKPGRLSPEEFEVMKRHTTIGAQTLDAALKQFPGTRFLEMARNIAYTHHERFDGSGYPNRLRGSEIPLCGRIVALADVYDALTSRRVYKAAFPHAAARTIIVEGRGTHFDPDVADAFTENERAFSEIRNRLCDEQKAAA